VHRHGRAVACAAAAWGVAIVGFGFADALWLALACLVAAGAMDSISGLFRSTIWNETIPAHLRGRVAGIEMLSWSSGPTLGGAAVIRIAGRCEECVRRPPCTRGCVAKVTNATGAGVETAS
jgi:hypothetical protein